MARKTKAELAAEREAYEAAQRAAEELAYPALLMRVLEEATTKNNYELKVKDGMFELRDRDASRDPVVELTYQYNTHSQSALEDLEWDLRGRAEERAESERRYAAKKAALAKLSTEERELLGL
jgi:hypothetical protein